METVFITQSFSISDPIYFHFKMDQITASPKVDFANLLFLALNECLPWNSLSLIVDNMTLNQDQSKNMIKILLKELQQLQTKLKSKQDAFNNLKQSSHEMAHFQTIELEVASENDIESVKDISENEIVSLIGDAQEKQTINELVINEDDNYHKEDFKNEFYEFIRNNPEVRSEEVLEDQNIPIKEENKSNSENTETSKNEKSFECDICGKLFKMLGCLKF